ncbi:hypothetical protein BGW80DRAFT_1340544 [Lactifluus volemus]|nr:hypothetical protein BGW80DRAFT_1340544 [Lactifluus volemus]
MSPPNAPLISMATDAVSSLCKPYLHPRLMPHLPCKHHVLALTYQFLGPFLIITTQPGHHRHRCYNNPQRFQPSAQ